MRFDNRVAVVLGSVALMLASVPALTRHPASGAVAAPPMPNTGSQVSAVADKPAPPRATVAEVDRARAAAAKPAAAGNIATTRVAVANIESVHAASLHPAASGNIATARPAFADVPLPRARPKTGSAVKTASVPLPRARPQSIAVANIPLPRARPQNIAVAKTPLPGEAAVVADASSEPSASGVIPKPPLSQARPQSITVANIPLPRARPQSLTVAKTPLPGEAVVVADVPSERSASGAVPNPPLPRARPHSIVVAQTPLPKARPQSLAVAKTLQPDRPTTVADASSKLPSDAETNPPAAEGSPQSAAASMTQQPSEPEVIADALSAPSLSAIETDPPPLPKARPDRMILVAEARRYLGTNPTNRSRLWCATFMNLILHKIGYVGTHSDAARSFVDYGRRIKGPRFGAIVVFSRGPNGGHVGVVTGVDRHGNPIVISGNHGHRVGKGVYPRSRVLAYVLPTRNTKRRTKSAQRQQHVSAATTQFAARGTMARTQVDGGTNSPAEELLKSMAAEYRRPSSATLRARSKRGRSASSALAKFFGGKS